MEPMVGRVGRQRSSVEISVRALLYMMNNARGAFTNWTPSISRVHPLLRNQDDEAYNPKFVSIGPLHHGKSEFQNMENLKLQYLHNLQRRSENDMLANYRNIISGRLRDVRNAYSEMVELSNEEFAKMLVVDGCFLVELIIQRASPAVDTRAFYFPSRAVFGFVWRDLLLLENQIPFFVLNLLFEEIKILYSHLREGGNSENLVSLALRCLCNELPPEKHPRAEDVRHLLHLKHLSMDPSLVQDPPYRRSYGQVAEILGKKLMNLISVAFLVPFYLIRLQDLWGLLGTANTPRETSMIPSAKELSEAGVAFKRKATPLEYRKASQLKVSFRDGTMEIPFLQVDDATNEELRNVVAFEQICCSVHFHFTDYCMFLCMIINTADDVALLRNSGILGCLGSDAMVAEMFNGLYKKVIFDYRMHYYAELFNDVAAFCEVPHHRWRANLKQTYFNSPSNIISLIPGFLLLLFAGLKTFYVI